MRALFGWPLGGSTAEILIKRPANVGGGGSDICPTPPPNVGGGGSDTCPPPYTVQKYHVKIDT